MGRALNSSRATQQAGQLAEPKTPKTPKTAPKTARKAASKAARKTAGKPARQSKHKPPSAPSTAPDAPATLSALSAERRQTFGLRVERWWPDLVSGLADVYPPEQAERLAARLRLIAETAYAEREPALQQLDEARTLAPDWFQSQRMLGYAAYTERFAGRLADITEQLPYLRELGVTYLHLMPLLRPRDGDSDGGYAVADYRTVRPDLGTTEDLRALTATLREQGISLVLDLVLNHVAREHEWAVRAREGDERRRRYFHVFDDRAGPDAYERTLPEVFPEFAPGNFTWDADLSAWVWTTFNDFQWDLDWSNPDVFAELAEIVLFLANAGVEVLRLDAIAFVWKRLGTNCQNQPEVHAITQALRALVRIACPATILKAEAIVSPGDLVHYLGQGRHWGRVSDLAYHNTLMVQIWSMLATRDVGLSVRALQQIPPVPTTTAWITYLRCHDDIGWAIDDGDAAAVGLSGFGHRAFLSDFFTGEYPPSFAEGLVFQANPATGDRRVSGTTSSLAGLDRAIAQGEGDAALDRVDQAIARILLAYAIVLGWGGVPVLWMGDEIGLPADRDWASEPGHEEDNRWFHRPRMTAAAQQGRHEPGTPAARLFAGFRRLSATRARLPHLHASIAAQALDPSDPGVLIVLRRHPEGDLLELANVTETWRPVPWHRIAERGWASARDELTGQDVRPGDDGQVWLSPYTVVWLTGG